ncbi:Mov34/MPN/PAD-1 family protein (macronuclear) [Tetrahymena thermophila SB210]|uniref:COP9 signalosome complex subunit 5 n=1 Tax=Tetrahymena thermophila (strain SB210) TaxID=312017 RepID=Q22D29_TETTS|nr:Mov34/MPN/PAD-1 family protein [Tetrahymena thermophila SB210]EAR83224.1 Mov34/MPN/PAD-1 family protein [Tetrahymena thermophila SB210]|eukprot:XP_001030887.1 Mov34/MPN/PAD-1 family protein [Tetrahymena thermophila SB210]
MNKDLKKFEEQNNIITDETLYFFDEKEQDKILDARPWRSDPRYFKKCKISLLALLKMLSHARMAGSNEVMGLPLGKIQGDTFLIMDVFALPVEATETRVSAGAECNEFMIQTIELLEKAGRKENVRGWYHSHPGYGPYLSGTDVMTQRLQQVGDPMVAIVIDPIRTMVSGKIQIGAFRTYPQDYNAPDDDHREFQSIPLEKIEDYGIHYKSYYQLEVSFFKNSLDNQLIEILWNKYWINTVTSSSLIVNNHYFVTGLNDLSSKISNQKSKSKKSDYLLTLDELLGKNSAQEKEPLKYALEKNQAVLSESIKNLLFSYKI